MTAKATLGLVASAAAVAAFSAGTAGEAFKPNSDAETFAYVAGTNWGRAMAAESPTAALKASEVAEHERRVGGTSSDDAEVTAAKAAAEEPKDGRDDRYGPYRLRRADGSDLEPDNSERGYATHAAVLTAADAFDGRLEIAHAPSGVTWHRPEGGEPGKRKPWSQV